MRTRKEASRVGIKGLQECIMHWQAAIFPVGRQHLGCHGIGGAAYLPGLRE